MASRRSKRFVSELSEKEQLKERARLRAIRSGSAPEPAAPKPRRTVKKATRHS